MGNQMDTEKAQDELIAFMLAPMQRKIDRLQAENKQRELEQLQYEDDLKAGLCVSKYGVWCECLECEEHSRAFDAVEDKQPDTTPYDALIQAGFDAAGAKKQLDIFDDLGLLP